MDCSPPGSSVHGILQARILEPFTPPGGLPQPGIKPAPPALQADALLSEPFGIIGYQKMVLSLKNNIHKLSQITFNTANSLIQAYQ